MSFDDYMKKSEEILHELDREYEMDKTHTDTMALSELRSLTYSWLKKYEKISKQPDISETGHITKDAMSIAEDAIMMTSRLINLFGSLRYAPNFLESYCIRLEKELEKCKCKKKISGIQKKLVYFYNSEASWYNLEMFQYGILKRMYMYFERIKNTS